MFDIMLEYICGAIFKDVLNGTKDLSCMQSHISSPVIPISRALEMQRKLLSICCVNIHRAIVYSTLILAIFDV